MSLQILQIGLYKTLCGTCPGKRAKSPPDPFFPKNSTADLESSRKRDFPVGDEAASGDSLCGPRVQVKQGGFPFRGQAARGVSLCGTRVRLRRSLSESSRKGDLPLGSCRRPLPASSHKGDVPLRLTSAAPQAFLASAAPQAFLPQGGFPFVVPSFAKSCIGLCRSDYTKLYAGHASKNLV